MSEVAVRGHHEQPAAVGVKPADRHQTRDRFDEIHHGAPLIRIAAHRDDADRFVEDDCDSNCFGGDAVPVDAYLIHRWVDHHAERTHLAVDGDATGCDEHVGAP